jgi:hypothetical protein
LKEHGETLLMRPQCGPDLEISKTKVLAIEECARTHEFKPAVLNMARLGNECLRLPGRVRLGPHPLGSSEKRMSDGVIHGVSQRGIVNLW